MIKNAIRKVVEGHSLTQEEAMQCMEEIMGGEATPAQIASLITALKMKGEVVEEVTGFVRVMRDKSLKVSVTADSQAHLVDTCGTGGDRLNTFNISTCAAFVVAGAGAKVAKHGNRAMSSACGSADVLESLGVRLDLTPEQIGQAIEEIGIGFMFAPAMHPAMKYAAPVRREIGIRTVFNILGPLTNPAGARRQVLGVFDPAMVPLMAEVLQSLGAIHALVMHGMDGLDEISTIGETIMAHLKEGHLKTSIVVPEDFGLERVTREDIAEGGSPEANARLLCAVLEGEQGPRRDIVLLNAAAAIMVADLAESLHEGIGMAAHAIDTGAALGRLEALIAFGQKAAAPPAT